MLKIFLWIWKTILVLIGINKNQSENNDTSSNQGSEDRIKILAYEVFREFQESQQAQFKTQQEAILAATQAQFKVQQESSNSGHHKSL